MVLHSRVKSDGLLTHRVRPSPSANTRYYHFHRVSLAIYLRKLVYRLDFVRSYEIVLKSFLSDIVYEFLSAMAIYLSRLHYEHSIDLYRVEKMKVMRNNNNKLRHTSPFFYLPPEDIYSTDIKTRINLIEKYTCRIKKSDLEHLYTSFFSSRESYIEISIEELGIESIFWKHFFYHPPKDKWSRSLHIWILKGEMMRVYRTKVFEKANTWDLRNILK